MKKLLLITGDIATGKSTFAFVTDVSTVSEILFQLFPRQILEIF